jgi:L-threonylcarbamoyladenylate synthase
MTEILDVTSEHRDDAIDRATAALQGGELVVIPTDTVYGVAADAFSPTGTRRVFQAKRRSRTFPLPVLIRSPKQLAGLTTSVPASAEPLMAAYWPGPLTIVVAAEPHLSWDLGDNQGTVAVRMPFDDVALDVIRAVGPLAVTSANLSGHPPATTAEAARRQLTDSVRYYLDAGPRNTRQPSTIVDLTRAEPHILREGVLAGEQVLAVARGEIDPLDVDLPPDVEDDLADRVEEDLADRVEGDLADRVEDDRADRVEDDLGDREDREDEADGASA